MKSCLNLEQYKYIYLFLSLLQFLAILGNNISLESPLDSKEIKPVNPKGNQP